MSAKGQELRSTNRPIYGASMITMNNRMYIYGGFYNVPPWNKEALWTLSNSIDKLSQLNTDPYLSPAVIYNTLESIDNTTMYSFGGHLDSKDIVVNGYKEQELLRYYKFDLQLFKWTPLQQQQQQQKSNVPLERFWHTTVQFNDTIYLFGGMNITHGLTLDFWKYQPISDYWINLNSLLKQPYNSRCGHTSTITNDGKMIVLGGFDCRNASFILPKRKELFSLSNAAIFDTIHTQWYDQPLQGDILPVPRTFHTAIIKNNDNKIIICGGQDGEMEPFQTYISGNHMVAILDVTTWQWTLPQEKKSPYQPFPRSFAVASLVNDTNMVYGLGLNYHTVYDGFYIFNLETYHWMSTVNDSLIDKGIIIKLAEHVMISTTLVIGLSIVGAIISLGLFMYWIMRRHKTSVLMLLKQVRKSIWHQRQGEPVWAEMSRFLFRFLFLAIFIVISVVLVLQIKYSPIIDQIHHDKTNLLNAPDIRFCFDGGDDWIPLLSCTTDFGQSCNQYVQNMTDKIASNVNYYGSTLTCYLFTGEHVYLANGSQQIQFYYNEPLNNNNNNRSIVHVEFYHPLHDPNKPMYDILGIFDTWYSKDESAKFQADEQANLKTENVYNLDPYQSSFIGYELTRREKIHFTLWNYIGFSTKRETLHQIKTSKTTSNNNNNQVKLYVYPSSDTIVVIREQRAFTIIHGIGIIGGIFGLMIGIQVNVFGYRPRSPWGIVHRWSIGHMRKSLLNGLRSKFSNQVDIPIIHPVHKRYSIKSPLEKVEEDDDEDKRIVKLEERLYVFEMLFQAYYIDDEVFRSLSTSNR